MRAPLRQKTRRAQAQSSFVQTFPAPVGGWNARDAWADMDPRDAIALENWFPQASYCEMRGGNSSWATGMANNGKTLAVWNGPSSSKMFCLTQAAVYDVTLSAAVGASVAARTNGKHQWVNFGDGTNNWLILVNGTDKPLYYSGAAWVAVDGGTVPAITGVTTTGLVNVFVSKGRLFFIENAKLGFWYMPAGAAGGAAAYFDLSPLAKKGGYVTAGATWTVDGGAGPDDYAVFITSEGEIIVYSGTNPASAAAWALVGVFELGRPLGRRCMSKFGGDLVIATESGVFAMSTALQAASIDFKAALSDKIRNAFTSAARSYGANFGWKPVVFPQRSALLVNIPISEDGTHEQYVMNTITKAWCKFNGWNAEDFAIFGGELYFTAGTKVLKAWNGLADLTSDVVAYGKTAFSYFGRREMEKNFKLFRPVLSVNGTLGFLTAIDVDFRDDIINGSATYTPVATALWDSAVWDLAFWAAGMEVVKSWTSPQSYPGYCAAGKIKVATQTVSVQWLACDYVYEPGNPL